MRKALMVFTAILGLGLGGCQPDESGAGVNLNPAEVKAALAGGEVQFVDVRTQPEWNSGRIKGAVHIPLHELEGRVGELDKSKPVITYCRSGNRSGRSLALLEHYGFKRVAHLAGGIQAWSAAGEPVEK